MAPVGGRGQRAAGLCLWLTVMKMKIVVLLAVSTLALAACGGSGDDSAKQPTTTKAGPTSSTATTVTTATTSTTASTATTATTLLDDGKNAPGCDTLQGRSTTLLRGLQVMVGLTTPEAVTAAKDPAAGLDLDGLSQFLDETEKLIADHPESGDATASVRFYRSIISATQDLLDKDPVTQADVDAYQQKVGDADGFLRHQAPIFRIVSERC